MPTDPLGAFARDLKAAVNDLGTMPEARREASELLAAAVSDEAPRVSGYLAGSVFVDDAGVGVGAVYAGVVHGNNPYAERAVDAVDWLAPFVDTVDGALDRHLQSIYL